MVVSLIPVETHIVEGLARNWAMVVIVSTLVVLALLAALIIVKYVRISLNIMRDTRPPLARNPLDFEPLSGEAVAFPAYDGLQLAGMLIRAAEGGPRRGMVIFAHEYCSDMQSCGRYCRPLVESGYDILAFDFRGHGLSPSEPGYTPRQWVTERELHDIRGAIAYARLWLERSGRAPEVGLFGISRGGCAAIIAAEELKEVRAIAVDGAYSTDQTIEYFMRRWAYIFATVRLLYENHHPAFWRFLRWNLMIAARREFKCQFPSVRKAISRMTPRPMLFIHGEKDSYLPVELGRRLYALAGEPKYFWVAAGARHNQAAVIHPEWYARRVCGFFNRHLGPTEGERRRAALQEASARLGAADSAEAAAVQGA